MELIFFIETVRFDAQWLEIDQLDMSLNPAEPEISNFNFNHYHHHDYEQNIQRMSFLPHSEHIMAWS